LLDVEVPAFGEGLPKVGPEAWAGAGAACDVSAALGAVSIQPTASKDSAEKRKAMVSDRVRIFITPRLKVAPTGATGKSTPFRVQKQGVRPIQMAMPERHRHRVI
jgi:hypothetical protein